MVSGGAGAAKHCRMNVFSLQVSPVSGCSGSSRCGQSTNQSNQYNKLILTDQMCVLAHEASTLADKANL